MQANSYLSVFLAADIAVAADYIVAIGRTVAADCIVVADCIVAAGRIVVAARIVVPGRIVAADCIVVLVRMIAFDCNSLSRKIAHKLVEPLADSFGVLLVVKFAAPVQAPIAPVARPGKYLSREQ